LNPRKHHHKLTHSIREIVRRMKPAGHNPIAVYREVLSIHGEGSVSANTVREIFQEFSSERDLTEQVADEAIILEGVNPNTLSQDEMEVESDLRHDFETNVVNAEDVSFTIPAAIIQLADSGADILIQSQDYSISIGRRKRF
jgi:hypothetical protein